MVNTGVQRLEINDPKDFEFTQSGNPVTYKGVLAGYDPDWYAFVIKELDQYEYIEELLVNWKGSKSMLFKKCSKVTGDKKVLVNSVLKILKF